MQSKHPKNYIWISSLYLVQGLPFFLVTVFAALLFKSLGVSNSQIAFVVSFLSLPWVLKPLWAPVVEIFSTKRRWVLVTHLSSAASVLLLSLVLARHNFFVLSLIALLLLAFSSATYDIASDGFYLLHLNVRDQALFVGLKSLFFQVASFFVEGFLIILVGVLAKHLFYLSAWRLTLVLVALVLGAFFFYHAWILPRDEKLRPVLLEAQPEKQHTSFAAVFKSFFAMPSILLLMVFLFVYNAAQIQLLRIVPLFLLDKPLSGGLGFSVTQVGLVYGIFGQGAMLAGTLVSGWIISRYSLVKYMLPVTFLAVILNSSYMLLGYGHGIGFNYVAILIFVVKFMYGITNGSYMVFLMRIFVSEKYTTAFYAFGTAIMALGALIFGASSGYMQNLLGYNGFFVWIFILGWFITSYTYLIFKLPAVKRKCYAISN